MIHELNALVKYQGEIMDNYEINIKSTKNYFFKDEKTINCKYRCAKCCHDLKMNCLCFWIMLRLLCGLSLLLFSFLNIYIFFLYFIKKKYIRKYIYIY